jgi:peptide-methionine (S)-S-oxide reductase
MSSPTERAILAGGCFWGVQDLLRRYPGVISTRVGYSGGDVRNATYRNHGTHAEAIEIIFNPKLISYRTLLEFFFQIHDPSTLNRQGNDRGLSYRSAIFYIGDEQKRIAEDTIEDVNASGLWPGKVVTELKPAGDSGKRNPSTRTTSSATRTDIPAISCARSGSSRFARRPNRPEAATLR